jgi:pre-rRNA-processing protein TSR4
VRGIRGVRIAKGSSGKAVILADKSTVEQKTVPEASPRPQLGESLFGVKSSTGTPTPTNPFANPFAASGAAKAPANPFAPAAAATNEQVATEASTTLPETFASKLKVGISSSPTTQPARPHEPWPPESDFSPYPSYYLDAEYETLDAPSRPQIPDNARMDMDTDGGAAGGKEDKEVFESSMDSTFQKFADRVGQNPEQVIRYEYRGRPLLYSDKDSVGESLANHAENTAPSHAKVTTSGSRGGGGMARCPNCGADRVFEVQLTPHAITELEAEDMSIDGIEWGTILLGVCSKDCKPDDVAEGEVGYLEEWVGVQWEEVEPHK